MGVRVRYRICGDVNGDPILLLHGWGQRVETFDQLSRDISRFYQVHVLEFPGHGESGQPPSDWAVEDFTRLTLAYMDFAKLTKVHLLGHSFGGRVAIRLAATAPERVNRLVLANAAGVPPRPTFRNRSRRLLLKSAGIAARRLGWIGLAFRDKVLSRVASSDYLNAGSLRGTFVRVVREDLTQFLHLIKASTLLIWGENDLETPVASAKTIVQHIPTARLVILARAGHFSYIDQFMRFRMELLAFLQDTRH